LGWSAPDSKQISVTKVNDAPAIGGVGGSIGYQQNGPAIVLAGSGTVVDPDSANFAGGVFVAQIQAGGGSAANRLYVGGPFVNSGNQVLLNGEIIGIRNTGGGQGFTKLEITLTAKATPAIVQQMLRAVRFRTVNNDKLDPRVVAFTVSDGDGGTSNTVTKTVNVTT
jgi:hypothetical protein